MNWPVEDHEWCDGNLAVMSAENAALKEQLATGSDALAVQWERAEKAETELEDIKEGFRATVDGNCAQDEKHCTCVPALRGALAAAQGLISEMRDEAKADLERAEKTEAALAAVEEECAVQLKTDQFRAALQQAVEALHNLQDHVLDGHFLQARVAIAEGKKVLGQ